MATDSDRSNNTFALFEATGKGQALNSDSVQYNAFSGTDIVAAMYIKDSSKTDINQNKFKVFASLQTISISSTRSIAPVRVLGRSSPLAYLRGARTTAGTLVFASINTDVFAEVYDIALAESLASSRSSLIADQLPPFSIVLTAATEKGGLAIQVIKGITLVNYGTTYSVEDIYTETVYSYIATDITPLFNSKSRADIDRVKSSLEDLEIRSGSAGKTLSSAVNEEYKTAMIRYPTQDELYNMGNTDAPPKLNYYRKQKAKDSSLRYGR